MRTTIEITEEQRAKLLEIAARRGAKGFSGIVQEALDAYLQGESSQRKTRRRATLLKGALRSADAERLREATRAIRASWR